MSLMTPLLIGIGSVFVPVIRVYSRVSALINKRPGAADWQSVGSDLTVAIEQWKHHESKENPATSTSTHKKAKS